MGSGFAASNLTHEIFFSSNHIRIIFTNSLFFFTAIFSREKKRFFFKHSLDTVNSLSSNNFLVLLLIKPWLSCSCTSHSIENYILRLLEAALGRRALGRRWQALRLFFRLLSRESQRLEGLARLRINTKTSSLFHLGCLYLVLAGVQHCWCSTYRLCSTVLLQSAAAILATGMYVIL